MKSVLSSLMVTLLFVVMAGCQTLPQDDPEVQALLEERGIELIHHSLLNEAHHDQMRLNEEILGFAYEPLGDEPVPVYLSAVCECVSSGVNLLCEHWYHNAVDLCTVLPNHWDYDWDFFGAGIGTHETSTNITLSCGIPFEYDTYSGGEISARFYGQGLSAAYYRTDVTTGVQYYEDECSISNGGYWYCMIYDIDPSYPKLMAYSRVTLTGHSNSSYRGRLVGIRYCYDPNSSD